MKDCTVPPNNDFDSPLPGWNDFYRCSEGYLSAAQVPVGTLNCCGQSEA